MHRWLADGKGGHRAIERQANESLDLQRTRDKLNQDERSLILGPLPQKEEGDDKSAPHDCGSKMTNGSFFCTGGGAVCAERHKSP